MNTENHRRLEVGGLSVTVDRKAIKNLHLGVYPPNGRVRVAAPLAVSDDAVRLAVIGKLGWIKRQRARFAAQPRESAREMVSGESHYFLGVRYRLRVVPHDGAGKIVLRGQSRLELRVRPELDAAQRLAVLQRWYRQRLREVVPPLLAHWETTLGVKAAGWGIRRMKTRWGSCNPVTGHVCVNLELAKKPVSCLEYVIVHELMHLVERRHDNRFVALMDRHLPEWQTQRQHLNSTPLAPEVW